MPDDLLTTVKKALDELAASDKSDGKYSGAELRRRAKALAGVQEPAEDWLRALLARCEAAEAEIERLNSPVLKSDWQQMVAERDAERIENTHLREAFVTMERAANEREAEAARLREALERIKVSARGLWEGEAARAALDTLAREGGEG